LITGVGPNGLGAALARSLAPHKPKLLILAGRTSSKVETVSKEITTSHPGLEVRVVIFDMSCFTSIAKGAEEINGYPEPIIDILFNNAGVMNIPERRLSAAGFEMHLATNYLGLALFTMSILPKIKQSAAGRIVNVTSNGYALSPFRFSDYNFDGRDLPDDEQPSMAACKAFGVPWGLHYIPPVAYGQSKTAVILFTRELADRLADTDVTVLCVNPGGELESVLSIGDCYADRPSSHRHGPLARNVPRDCGCHHEHTPADEKRDARRVHAACCCA
jgi:NAD(P)-dependent dehydrogenase (short-subunit alcohol dehydrogenase family)